MGTMIGWLALAAAAGLAGWWTWEKSHRKIHPVRPGIQRLKEAKAADPALRNALEGASA